MAIPTYWLTGALTDAAHRVRDDERPATAKQIGELARLLAARPDVNDQYTYWAFCPYADLTHDGAAALITASKGE